MKIATWNVEWATPRSRRTPEILRRLADLGAEIICLTETDKDLLGTEGHTITARPDYGYGLQRSRRKALLWSKNPWNVVDDVVDAELQLRHRAGPQAARLHVLL